VKIPVRVHTDAPAPVRPEPVLRVADRCDRCGAQALVRVEVGGLPLDLCGHDYREYEPALLAAGVRVLADDRFARLGWPVPLTEGDRP
jgi:hypothetical protein